eukprot:506823-Amphidinium_carterae.1
MPWGSVRASADHESVDDVSDAVPIIHGAIGEAEIGVTVGKSSWGSVAAKPHVLELSIDSEIGVEAAETEAPVNRERSKEVQKGGRPRKKPKSIDSILAEAKLSIGGAASSCSVDVDLEQDKVAKLHTQPKDLSIIVPHMECKSLQVQPRVTYVNQVLSGYTLPSINIDALLCAVHEARGCSLGGRNQYDRLQAGFFDCNQPPSQTSAVAHAQRLDVAPETMFIRHLLEKNIGLSFNEAAKLIYIDAIMFDETPMKTTIKENPRGVLDSTGLECSETQQQWADAQVFASLGAGVRSQGLKTKLVQSQQTYGVLLWTPQGYIHFRGTTVNPLFAVDRCTAETLQTGLARLNGVSSVARQFAQSVRLAMTDKGGANLRSESAVSQAREGWSACQVLCQVHSTANACSRSIDELFPEHVHGLLHLSLSLKEAGAMAKGHCFQ